MSSSNILKDYAVNKAVVGIAAHKATALPRLSISEVSKQSMMSGNEMHRNKQAIVCPIERLGECGEALRNGLHSRKRPAPNSNFVHKSSLNLSILGDHGRYVRCVWLNHWSCL